MTDIVYFEPISAVDIKDAVEKEKENKKRIFIYKSKEEFKHPNLGKYFLARFSMEHNDRILRKKGYLKTLNNEIMYYLGTFDGIFEDWSSAKLMKHRIRYKSDLKNFVNEYENNKKRNHIIVSEIFTI